MSEDAVVHSLSVAVHRDRAFEVIRHLTNNPELICRTAKQIYQSSTRPMQKIAMIQAITDRVISLSTNDNSLYYLIGRGQFDSDESWNAACQCVNEGNPSIWRTARFRMAGFDAVDISCCMASSSSGNRPSSSWSNRAIS